MPTQLIDSAAVSIEQNYLTKIQQPQYQPVVRELLAYLKSGLKDNLHSVYLYGSVASGRAVSDVSNLDVVLVTHRPFSNTRTTLFNTINWRFQRTYPFVDGVSIRAALVKEVVSLDALFTWGFLLKECCICLDGDDLAEYFGHFDPSWEIAKQWNMDISDWLPVIRQQIAQVTDIRRQVKLQRKLAKKLLRAAYCLVMHKEKVWIDDPTLCGQRFLHYCPQHQQTILRLGILLGDRVIPKRSVVGLLDSFGPWLVDEYKKTEFKIG